MNRYILKNIAIISTLWLMLSFPASSQISEMVTIDQLMKKIDKRDQKISERDKVIDDLLHRVKQLEQNTTPSKSYPARKRVSQKQRIKKAGSVAKKQAKSTPGSFEIDEDAAQRALERVLVQTGALLLPFGKLEIQPFATYSRNEASRVGALNNQIGNISNRRNSFSLGATFLLGLPFESQLELRVPYRLTNESSVSFGNETSNTGYSFGDIRLGLAKTLWHETDWTPDLIARFKWNAPSGTLFDNNVFLGEGFHAFTTSITALKRQDPLAFTASIAYKNTLEKNGFEPGDSLRLLLSTTLAASPQTSLSLGFQQVYTFEDKRNNIAIPGSDRVTSSFTIGASSTIGRNLFFTISGGIGLTETAPDYFVNISVPFRFNIPFQSLAKKL